MYQTWNGWRLCYMDTGRKAMTLKDITYIVKPLADKYKIQKVYLFGSYARDEATCRRASQST